MSRFDDCGWDGSGRDPWPTQKEFLYWFEKQTAEITAVIAPTASGKTLLARSIQRAYPRTKILTISNALVNQFANGYDSMTRYYGATNYRTKEEYKYAQDIACCSDTHVVSNPIALFFLKKRRPDYEEPDMFVLDEADQLITLMELLIVKNMPIKRNLGYRFGLRPGVTPSPDKVADFLTIYTDSARAKYKEKADNPKTKFKTLADLETRIDKMDTLIQGLRNEPESFALKVEEMKTGYWNLSIRPVRVPHFLFRDLFGKARIVLMSSTIFLADLLETFPTKTIAKMELPSPIEVSRRRVLYAPLRVDKMFPFPFKEMAEHLDKLLEKYKELRPALLHCSYSTAAELKKYMKTPALTYSDKEEKATTVKRWTEEGGVLIGPGLTTGWDFKQELLRLNIIVRIQFPNQGDAYVLKRQALSPEWGGREALRHAIQAAGRSTRTPDDYSLTLVVDPRWSSLYTKYSERIPKFFREAVSLEVLTLD